MTLESKSILQEGWITLFKNRRATLFSRAGPNKQLERAWAVLGLFSSKGPSLVFYQDNRKLHKVMRRERLELSSVRLVYKMLDHPKHPHCMMLQLKGSRRVLLNTDNAKELDLWLKVVCEQLNTDYKLEKVIWEYLDDGGLWQAFVDQDSYHIETHYCEHSHHFHIGDYQYNLHHLTRTQARTKHCHRIKRTPFVEDQPSVLHKMMADLPAIWEWGYPARKQWHPFERDINIQLEEMYDSGSQWVEMTLCLPSPMPFLLDLHDMKLVNFRTAAHYSLRRTDNSDNITYAVALPQPRSPSPDDFEKNFQESAISPMGSIFKSLQDHLRHLQIVRSNIRYKEMIGEGAFGEVHLAEVSDLPGYSASADVAVKQLRLSDFIARHGHHSQQMEDFLREAKEMAKINNHRIVKLIAVCTLDYPLLLIEEYMNQGDLLGVLKDSRPSMPLTTQLKFAHHTADGMSYLANELSCVHRDLAARNILVHKHPSGDMEAKIADFGLSRHLYSDMYKHQTSKPRPLPAKWMALESLMYFIFTTRSDVWSFGVLLWEIMTLGRTPYPGVENRELLEQIEEKGLKLSRPKPCPIVVFEMILDCTQHQADERPTFGVLRDKLLEYLKQAEEGKLVCEDASASKGTSPTATDSTEHPASSSSPPPPPANPPPPSTSTVGGAVGNSVPTSLCAVGTATKTTGAATSEGCSSTTAAACADSSSTPQSNDTTTEATSERESQCATEQQGPSCSPPQAQQPTSSTGGGGGGGGGGDASACEKQQGQEKEKEQGQRPSPSKPSCTATTSSAPTSPTAPQDDTPVLVQGQDFCTSLPTSPAAEQEAAGSPSLSTEKRPHNQSLKEVTQPLGHVYYLLDPDDFGQQARLSKQQQQQPGPVCNTVNDNKIKRHVPT